MTNKKAKIRALEALETQHNFVNILINCGDATDNPQYYEAQRENLRGMIDMFDIIFGDAPYTAAATQRMLEDLKVC